MSAELSQSSLIEKGLLFCGYGGIALSLLAGLFGITSGFSAQETLAGFILLIPAAVGFAAGVALLALAEILKYLRSIASSSVPETFK